MKQFYLIGNDDGIRFVPSVALYYAVPCMIYGELSLDDDFLFGSDELCKLNTLICTVDIDESHQDSNFSDFCRFGIKVPKNK